MDDNDIIELSNIPLLTVDSLKILEYYTSEQNEQLIINHIDHYCKNVLTDVQKEILQGINIKRDWFNVSEPIDYKKDLSSSIVVLDFFTYCCINCLHILPDLEELEGRYKQNASPVIVIGVHSAKFPNEQLKGSISNAVENYKISHPVVNDDGCKLWSNLQISCWPTLLIMGPGCVPLCLIMGEGKNYFLQNFIDIAVDYFNNIGNLYNPSLPLQVSHTAKSTFNQYSFPGKIICINEDLAVSDSGNNRILIISTTGIVKKIIGCGKRGLKDGTYEECMFNRPQGLAFQNETLFVADTDNHCIRQINLNEEIVKTIAGNGKQGTDKEGGKLWTNQDISSPWDLCLIHSVDCNKENHANILLVAMSGLHQIWAVFLKNGYWIKNSYYEEGTVVNLAGSGIEENRNSSYPLKAGFAQPSGIAFSPKDSLVYIADSESSSIRSFSTLNGNVKKVVGGALDPMNLFAYGDSDGRAKEVLLQHPLGVCTGNDGVYVADSYNHKVKFISKNEKSEFVCSTLIGNSNESPSSNTLNEPGGLCFSKGKGILYIADTNNHIVKSYNIFQPDKLPTEIPLQFDDVDTSDQIIKRIIYVKNENHSVNVKFILNLPSSAKLNEEAPNKYKVLLLDNGIQIDHMTGNVPGEIYFTVNLSNTEEAKCALCLSVFICYNDQLCSMYSFRYDFLFRKSEDKEDHTLECILSIPQNSE